VLGAPRSATMGCISKEHRRYGVLYPCLGALGYNFVNASKETFLYVSSWQVLVNSQTVKRLGIFPSIVSAGSSAVMAVLRDICFP
jgi:hypothetical protein